MVMLLAERFADTLSSDPYRATVAQIRRPEPRKVNPLP